MSLAFPTTHRTFDASPTTRSGSANEFSQDDEQSLFSREELRQFATDDVTIGRQIAKILSMLFVYPLVVMTVVIWWTLRTVGH